MIKCSRRMFLLGTATTFAGAYAAACGSSPSADIAATEIPIGSAKIVDGVIFTQPKEGEFKAYSQTLSPPAQSNHRDRWHDGHLHGAQHLLQSQRWKRNLRPGARSIGRIRS